MDQSEREYELVLMLDPGLEDPARDKLAQDARAQIEAGGTLKRESTWGLRKLAFEIRQRTEADYRWYRFEAPRELLGSLDHNLKIADGVLRFRIFKVDPDAPVIEAPPTGPALGSARSGGERGERGERGPRSEDRAPSPAPSEVAEPAAAAPAEAEPAAAAPAEPAE